MVAVKLAVRDIGYHTLRIDISTNPAEKLQLYELHTGGGCMTVTFSRLSQRDIAISLPCKQMQSQRKAKKWRTRHSGTFQKAKEWIRRIPWCGPQTQWYPIGRHDVEVYAYRSLIVFFTSCYLLVLLVLSAWRVRRTGWPGWGILESWSLRYDYLGACGVGEVTGNGKLQDLGFSQDSAWMLRKEICIRQRV